jgi:hypothetical protein
VICTKIVVHWVSFHSAQIRTMLPYRTIHVLLSSVLFCDSHDSNDSIRNLPKRLYLLQYFKSM